MKRLLISTFIIITLTAITHIANAKPFKHSFGEWRDYNGAWLAVCPEEIQPENAKYGYYYTHCWAVAGSQKKNSVDYPVFSFRLYRDRQDGSLQFGFTYATSEPSERLDENRMLSFTIDQHPPSNYSFFKDLEARHNTGNEYYIKDPAKVMTLVLALRKGAHMQVEVPVFFGDQQETRRVNIWLKGVQASERFMKAYAAPR